jgi:hypothetical protein
MATCSVSGLKFSALTFQNRPLAKIPEALKMKAHSLLLISIVYSGTVFAQHGRSLFGLIEALKQKNHEAALVNRQFEAAWKNADTKLSLDLL